MKKIFLLLNIFALSLLVACNPNEYATFNDKDAFVAFDGANYSISEQGASISIPVTLASLKGIETTVTVAGVDGTAAAGVNYNIKNGGKLSFNKDTRTAYVEVEIIDMPGIYTGDLKFQLTFTDLGGVNAGNRATASVTIQDIDHPLSPILGTYNVSGVSYFNGATNTYMIFEKDASDETKVWIRNLFCNPGWDIPTTALYGVVNSDLTQITIPLGQTTAYTYSGSSVYLFGCTADLEIYDSGNIIIDLKDGGKSFEINDMAPALYIDGAGYVNIMLPPVTGTKAE